MSQVGVQDVFKVFLKSAKSLSIFASQQSNVQHTSRMVLVQKVKDITFVLDCFLLVPAKNCHSDIPLLHMAWLTPAATTGW